MGDGQLTNTHWKLEAQTAVAILNRVDDVIITGRGPDVDAEAVVFHPIISHVNRVENKTI